MSKMFESKATIESVRSKAMRKTMIGIVVGLCLLCASCGTTGSVETLNAIPSKYKSTGEATIEFVGKTDAEKSVIMITMAREIYEQENKLAQYNELFGSCNGECVYDIRVYDRFGRKLNEGPIPLHALVSKYDNFDERVTFGKRYTAKVAYLSDEYATGHWDMEVYDIGNGLPTKEEIEAARKKEADLDAEIDARMAELATASNFSHIHGRNESQENVKKFSANALEEGHLYYLVGFTPDKNNANYAYISGLGITLSSLIPVQYANDSLKNRILNAAFGMQYIMLGVPQDIIVVIGKKDGKNIVYVYVELNE